MAEKESSEWLKSEGMGGWVSGVETRTKMRVGDGKEGEGEEEGEGRGGGEEEGVGVVGESIFSAFVLQEAVRLVERVGEAEVEGEEEALVM